jgi:hypothetical protein
VGSPRRRLTWRLGTRSGRAPKVALENIGNKFIPTLAGSVRLMSARTDKNALDSDYISVCLSL